MGDIDGRVVAITVAACRRIRASFITGGELPVDGGYSTIGPEALGQPFEKVRTIR